MSNIKAVEVVPGPIYLARVTLGALRAYCVVDPEHVDTAPENLLKHNEQLRAARKMRGRNQRSWKKKARRNRRDVYAHYIKAVRTGTRMGGFPPITMWTRSKAEFDAGVLDIPYSAVMCALDGETQLSAWFKLAEKDTTWLDQPIAIVLYVNCEDQAADQMLHDFNHYATPVSETEMALHNHEGALTSAIRTGYEMSKRLLDVVVNRSSDSVGKFSTTEPRIIELAIGAAFGTDGFAMQTRQAAERGNAQFYDLPTSSTVSAAVADFLRVDDEQMKRVTKTCARAVGVYYHTHGRLPSQFPNKADEAIAKAAIPQKSKQLQVVAKKIFEKMEAPR